MLNTFGSKWQIVIIGEFYDLDWNESSHLHFSAPKPKKKNSMVLQDALSAVDAAKPFYQII